VGIPWKKEEPNLNNNYDMALIRLKSQEKSLERKGSEATHTYNKIIEDYEKKGYVKKIEKTNEINQLMVFATFCCNQGRKNNYKDTNRI
jgi:hypothetical protein